MSAWFDILRLKPGTLYPGAAQDIDQRMLDHKSGRACRTTRLDPPAALVHQEEFETYREARRREAQVKRWTRLKKEALVAGDFQSLRNLAKRRQRRP